MSKNHAGFNIEEVEIIDEIIATLMIKLYYFVEYYKDHHQYAENLSEVLRSDSVLAFGTLFLNIKNMDPSKPLSPEDINKELATKLSEESETYLDSPALSKVLKRFKEEKILDNIRGKRNVKREIPQVIRSKKHSDKPKPQGYHSFYKVTDEVEKYKRVLSNPLALKHITERLKNSGLLEPAYTRIAESIFYAMMNSDERAEKFFRMSINAGAPHIRPTDSDWTAFKEALHLLDNNQLNNLIKEFVDNLMGNPSDYLFLVLSLPRLDLD
jgi:hypothetical protein